MRNTHESNPHSRSNSMRGRTLIQFEPFRYSEVLWIPQSLFPSLGYSYAASVRANEVLDCLSIPSYGCFISSHFQLGAVVLNTKKQPVSHPFPAIGNFEKLLDSDEAAALLGIHKKTLQANGPDRRNPWLPNWGPLEISGINSERMASVEARELNQEFHRVALDYA